MFRRSSPHSLPQICCRGACEVQHLLETKHGCREPKQQYKMHFSRASLFTVSEKSLCTAAWTHPTKPPTQGARSSPSDINCHASFGKPACFKEYHCTQRSNFPTVDQLAEHQTHVKNYKDQTGLTKPGLALHFCKATPVPFKLRESQQWTASWEIHKSKHNRSYWKEIKHNPWSKGFFPNIFLSFYRQIFEFLLYTLQLYVLYSRVPSCNHLTQHSKDKHGGDVLRRNIAGSDWLLQEANWVMLELGTDYPQHRLKGEASNSLWWKAGCKFSLNKRPNQSFNLNNPAETSVTHYYTK